uniref:Integrase, catalytic region, zinc finger, CCHC-type, peptidase aspartic, catalytic n=1 Tax=Tanacetum cinerariifolium TaxID=118510 RepID=A0A699RPM3_TANCI|nr:hypothetical protein [Tanacetum cinerariifolium]
MKYSEIIKAQQLQDDCDVQTTNIILYDLPPDVYAFVNHQEVAKDIWDRVKMLMKDTELSYQEHECRLYNLFDKFTYVQGETLYEYYWRFSQLINDMHTIGMTMQQVQFNTKFLNALPSEWIKFVTSRCSCIGCQLFNSILSISVTTTFRFFNVSTSSAIHTSLCSTHSSSITSHSSQSTTTFSFPSTIHISICDTTNSS